MRELQQHVSSLTGQLKQANKAIEFFKNMMNKDGKLDSTEESSVPLNKILDTLDQDAISLRYGDEKSPRITVRQSSKKKLNESRISDASGNFYTNRSLEKGANFGSAQKSQNQVFTEYLKDETAKLQNVIGVDLMQLDKSVLAEKVYD